MTWSASQDAGVCPAWVVVWSSCQSDDELHPGQASRSAVAYVPHESLRADQRVSRSIPPSTDCAGRTIEPLKHNSASVAAAWQRRVDSARRQHRAPAVRSPHQCRSLRAARRDAVRRSVGRLCPRASGAEHRPVVMLFSLGQIGPRHPPSQSTLRHVAYRAWAGPRGRGASGFPFHALRGQVQPALARRTSRQRPLKLMRLDRGRSRRGASRESRRRGPGPRPGHHAPRVRRRRRPPRPRPCCPAGGRP